MSVLITISHPLSRLASSIVLAQVRSEFWLILKTFTPVLTNVKAGWFKLRSYRTLRLYRSTFKVHVKKIWIRFTVTFRRSGHRRWFRNWQQKFTVQFIQGFIITLWWRDSDVDCGLMLGFFDEELCGGCCVNLIFFIVIFGAFRFLWIRIRKQCFR